MREVRPTRRALLAGGAGLAVAAAAPRPARRWIDTHHHFAAPATDEFNRRFVPGAQPSPWRLEADLADMAAAGVSLAVLSSFTPSVGGTAEDRSNLSRAINTFGAGLVRDHPGRYALFATLPLPDVAASLAEAAYALDHLGALGLTVYTDAGKLYLGDPSFEPLWAELDRRGAVVFVHPHAPECCAGIVKNVPDTLIEFGAATTRTLASLLFNRVTLRFPHIRWIFPHGGGAMPFVIERFLAGGEVELVPGVKTRGGRISLSVPPETVLSELKRLHFDTAQIANPVSLDALKKVVGASQILYGTDYWFRTEVETRAAVEHCRVFSPAELDLVAWRNAERLIPALAGKA